VHPNRPVAAAALSIAAAVVLAGCSSWPDLPARDAATAGPSPSTAAAPTSTVLPTFDPATAVGRYAPGFPTDLLRAPGDATVLASSARPVGDGPLVEVTLNLATTSSARAVLSQLGKRLRKAGFEQSPSDAAPGLAAQTAFTRTSERRKAPLVESLMVAVLDDGDRRLVTISGSVVAKD
jgi:hypothetical protein